MRKWVWKKRRKRRNWRTPWLIHQRSRGRAVIKNWWVEMNVSSLLLWTTPTRYATPNAPAKTTIYSQNRPSTVSQTDRQHQVKMQCNATIIPHEMPCRQNSPAQHATQFSNRFKSKTPSRNYVDCRAKGRNQHIWQSGNLSNAKHPN